MQPVRLHLALVALVALTACNESNGYTVPGPRPEIVQTTGPAGGVDACHPAKTAGVCPLSLSVTFRLPPEDFVSTAIVRFQGDGSDTGVDRRYSLPPTYGKGAEPVTVMVSTSVPATIVRSGALFTYSVRIVTGLGDESDDSTLTVSVQ